MARLLRDEVVKIRNHNKNSKFIYFLSVEPLEEERRRRDDSDNSSSGEFTKFERKNNVGLKIVFFLETQNNIHFKINVFL